MEIMPNLGWELPCNPEDKVKEWFVNCCRNVSRRVSTVIPDEDNQPPFFRNNIKRFVNLVITPNTVPDFTIPKSYGSPTSDGAPESLSECDDFITSDPWARGAAEAGSRNSSRYATPANSPMLQRHKNTRVALTKSSSEPASLDIETPSVSQFKRSHTISYDMIDEKPEGTTNADPRSRAAMSLPHLKTKTKFGFETLSECPKTKRKESLFHGAYTSVGTSANWGRKGFLLSQTNKMSKSDDALSSTSDTGSEHQKRTSSKRRNVTSMVRPLGVTMSPQDSLDDSVSSTQASRSPPRTPSFDQGPIATPSESSEGSPPSLSERRRRFITRRPASVNHEDLPSFASNKDERPAAMLRNGSINDVSLRQEELLQLWRISAVTNTRGVKRYPPVASEASPLRSTVIPRTEYYGELKFKVSYDVERCTLDVHILEGINLGGSIHGSNPVNAFVKVTLSPSGLQKYTTSIVKRNNDPVFDQLFTFTDVSLEDLKSIRLCMKLFNRERLRRKNELLGEVVLDLADLDFELVTCHELIREVEAEEVPVELGRLQAKICFHANKQKLDVTILRIKDLPRQAITGAPDTYVTLELHQPGRPDICLQSKIKKKATSATLNETFTFDISPKIEDLNYTCLSLTVYEREMILSDRVIGEVRLGFGATEESEFDHWNNVLTTPGKEFQMWHMIMEEE